MQIFAVLALAATAVAQLSGCSSSVSGTFNIQTVNAAKKRDLETRATTLTLTLQSGILKDSEGRYGYIASNYQFQFDNPLQAGARQSTGWSLCSNGSLALNSAIWYQCLSGTFYNLYSESTGAQCSPITIQAVNIASGSASAVSQITDGQAQASSARSVVTQITDGQVQASSARAVVTQITDGQIQASSARALVTQITDGQIQASSAASKLVSQITDGQVQASSAASKLVSQITDGQVQASSAASKLVSQISDGQIQAAATTSRSNVTANSTVTRTTAAQYTGAAATGNAAAGAFAVGIAGLFALL